ncbi:hypothetical protein [Streptomyces sp. NWU49]|uniref:hypothetical protein n=1 Tax=Streptomyces sp. NWU49 TaxID=2201153 RepID=UPI0015E827E5|nr:hypothetical protein [Streptomyces sp. NWU49]
MSKEQRDQQQAPAPQQQEPAPQAGIAQKGALAAIGGAFSGAARAVVAHLLGDVS